MEGEKDQEAKGGTRFFGGEGHLERTSSEGGGLRANDREVNIFLGENRKKNPLDLTPMSIPLWRPSRGE